MRVLILLLAFVASGCSMVAPPYQVSIENVQELKRANLQEIQVGEISSTPNLNTISLRGSKMKSPVGKSYGEYINAALVDELKLAKLWNGVSANVVTGEVIENDINVAGFSTGNGKLAVKFTVINNGDVLFDKVIAVETEFDSSFMGAVAIPNAQAHYVELVQTLFAALFSDNDFVTALKGD